MLGVPYIDIWCPYGIVEIPLFTQPAHRYPSNQSTRQTTYVYITMNVVVFNCFMIRITYHTAFHLCSATTRATKTKKDTQKAVSRNILYFRERKRSFTQIADNINQMPMMDINRLSIQPPIGRQKSWRGSTITPMYSSILQKIRQ